MKKYIGTKHIEAEPMSMGEAYERGLLQAGRIPNTAQKEKKGYHIRYEDGYESWSPAEVFEKAYKQVDTDGDRMYVEMEELKAKIDELHAFINSSAFHDLPIMKQLWRKDLLKAMASYCIVLEELTKMEFGELTLNAN